MCLKIQIVELVDSVLVENKESFDSRIIKLVKKELTKSQKSKIVSLYKGNSRKPSMRISQIIKEMGVSKNKVRRVLHEEGLKKYSEGSL